MASKPKKSSTTFKFDKTVDSGPMDYANMDRALAETLHQERIRRQVTSRLKGPGTKKGY